MLLAVTKAVEWRRGAIGPVMHYFIIVIILDGLNGRDAGHAGRHWGPGHVDWGGEEAVEVWGRGGWVRVNMRERGPKTMITIFMEILYSLENENTYL